MMTTKDDWLPYTLVVVVERKMSHSGRPWARTRNEQRKKETEKKRIGRRGPFLYAKKSRYCDSDYNGVVCVYRRHEILIHSTDEAFMFDTYRWSNQCGGLIDYPHSWWALKVLRRWIRKLGRSVNVIPRFSCWVLAQLFACLEIMMCVYSSHQLYIRGRKNFSFQLCFPAIIYYF